MLVHLFLHCTKINFCVMLLKYLLNKYINKYMLLIIGEDVNEKETFKILVSIC